MSRLTCHFSIWIFSIIWSNGLISFRYFSVPIKINFFFARVIATFNLFKSFKSTPFSPVCLVQEIITTSQSMPYALSIVNTYLSPYWAKWLRSNICYSRNGAITVILEGSIPHSVKWTMIFEIKAASTKFLCLNFSRSFKSIFNITLSVLRNETDRDFISSSQIRLVVT